MLSEQLANALNLCKGSLLTIEFMEGLTDFHFDQNTVLAWNDVTAVIVPLETDVDCSLRGDLLLSLIGTLPKKKTVKLVEEDNKVILTCGRAKLELAAKKGKKPFTPPKKMEGIRVTLTKSLIEGFDLCLKTTGEDAMQRAYTGVGIRLRENGVRLYSSDMNVGSTFWEAGACEGDDKVRMLPKIFVQQLTSIWRTLEEQEGEMHVSEDWVHAVIGGEDGVMLYSKLMAEEAPAYQKNFGTLLKDCADAYVPIPGSLASAIDRAAILQLEQEKECVLRSEGDTLIIEAAGKGKLLDQVKVKWQLPKLAHKVDPARILPLIKLADDFAFTKAAIAVRKGKYECLAAVLGD